MNKIIIALASTQGAGKSFLSEYLREKYNGISFRYSDYLSKILKILNIEKTRKNLQDLSLALRNQFGQDVLEKSILRDIWDNEAKINIIDGVRRLADISRLKNEKNFYLIFIDADLEIRVQRLSGRGEKADDQKVTEEIIRKESQHDSETRVKELKEIANFIVENNGSKEEFEKKIDQIMEEILKNSSK